MKSNRKGFYKYIASKSFSWDRVNFLLSSWCSAVFWIWCENNVDMAHWCFSCCWVMFIPKSRTFQFLRPCQREGWRGTGNWEGTQPGQVTWTSQRDIPYHMTCHAEYINWGRRRKVGTSGIMAFVFPSNHYAWWSPAFLGMAEHLPACGK